MSWWYILNFITCIILANLLFVAGTYLHSYIKWFVFLRDYQLLSNRLDKDIILLKGGKFDEVKAREQETEQLIERFITKYPLDNNIE